jgi:hypothetical protein
MAGRELGRKFFGNLETKWKFQLRRGNTGLYGPFPK